MSMTRDYLWLLIGAVGAIAVPVSGAGGWIASALEGVVPLPWGQIGLGIMIFAAASGLHFRLQLVRCLDGRRAEVERRGAASRLVRAAVDDGRRWLRVIQENLELVGGGPRDQPQERLYLEGAQAHADKLEQAFDRIEGNQSELDRPPS